MKREVITTGKNIDDAIEAAVAELGVDRDDVSVEIIDTPSRGFLGLGGSLAKVRVWVGEDDEVPAAEEKPVVKEEKKAKKRKKTIISLILLLLVFAIPVGLLVYTLMPLIPFIIELINSFV